MQDSGATQPSRTVVIERGGPGCLLRALWFIFVGGWLALAWIAVAWIFNITIIGLPVGLAMLNRVPQVMTLSPGPEQEWWYTSLGASRASAAGASSSRSCCGWCTSSS